ncbi:MAG: phosphomannomutase/phosphoglucomutase, partial [Pseudomonadota bacterium]
NELNVVWDFGNGASGAVAKPLLAKLPGNHISLYEDVDGTFPNHHPDPTVPANLVDLQAAVAEHRADIGVAFDGDGDRIGAVDQNGSILFGDHLIAIYAAETLAQHPGGTVIADVKASQTLFDEIARLGGEPVMWKTGHSLIKDKMKELDAPLAGEMSGHIFFRENYGFDDALYCAIKLISIASKAGKPVSDLISHMPSTHSTPETRFQVDEVRKFPAIEEVQKRLAAQSDLDVNDMDGVRVNTPDGWWLLRASNTQDVLVARAESTSPEGLERLKDMVRQQLAESGIDAPSDF